MTGYAAIPPGKLAYPAPLPHHPHQRHRTPSQEYSYSYPQNYAIASPTRIKSSTCLPPALPASSVPSTEPSILAEPSDLISDMEAAALVETHLSQRHSDPAQLAAERKLIQLMGTYPFCADSIISEVMACADTLFFRGQLKSRVQWRWANTCSGSPSIIGTTSLREVGPGDYMTQITLSKAALRREEFDQRLVIAAILHEAIHSYLFVVRGFWARREGGHTDGFRAIAGLIDDWVGNDFLRLRDVEARLEHFRTSRRTKAFERVEKGVSGRVGKRRRMGAR